MFGVSSICSYNVAQTKSEILHHSLKSRSCNAFNGGLSTHSDLLSKLKLNCKLSPSHNWVVVVWIIRSNNEYALRNSRHFHKKINNNSPPPEKKRKNPPTHWIYPPSFNVISQTVFDNLIFLFKALITGYGIKHLWKKYRDLYLKPH